MLLELEIRNFALIDKIHISFQDGLNVLSGETGVGKSVLINALKLTLGERADRDWIQKDSEVAFLQSVFQVDPEITAQLQERRIDSSEELLILSRELHRNGKSISRVNGSIVTNACIRDIASFLVDIHGQHSHQSLLNKSKHIDFLDDYIGKDAHDLLKEYRKTYTEFQTIEKEKEKLSIDDQHRERQMDLLNFQIQEIKNADLREEEEENLVNEIRKHANTKKIFEHLGRALVTFKGDIKSPGIYDGLSQLQDEFAPITGINSEVDDFKERVDELQFQIDDLYNEMRNYHDLIEYDPERLSFIDNRLSEINDLKRKYGSNVSEILEYLAKSLDEYETLKNSKEVIERLSLNEKKLRDELKRLADELHCYRKKASSTLESNLKTELKALNIPHGELSIQFNLSADKKSWEFNNKGYDQVEFLIKTNVGETFKPLVKIASGGEISRVMLALKSILADVDRIPCLVFDEIDTGISGETGHLVGDKLQDISKNRQVICITHLAQIAARGKSHYKIYKKDQTDKTSTYVDKLSFKERIEEVGRLLGGKNTDLTKSHAKELIDQHQSLN